MKGSIRRAETGGPEIKKCCVDIRQMSGTLLEGDRIGPRSNRFGGRVRRAPFADPAGPQSGRGRTGVNQTASTEKREQQKSETWSSLHLIPLIIGWLHHCHCSYLTLYLPLSFAVKLLIICLAYEICFISEISSSNEKLTFLCFRLPWKWGSYYLVYEWIVFFKDLIPGNKGPIYRM